MDAGSKKELKRCANCGFQPLRKETVTDRFEYGPEGEKPISIVAENVPVEACPNCGETYFGPAAAKVQHAAVCRALGLLTPEEIQALRERLGPTQADFARLTGIGEATISRWERGRMLPNRAMDFYLRLLQREDNERRLRTWTQGPAESSPIKAEFRCLRDIEKTRSRSRRFALAA